MELRKEKREFHLHFVGIGGIGMSGIAQAFFNQGYRITGSDLVESETTRRLIDHGMEVTVGHREGNIQSPDVVVISSAIDSSNPEVREANRLRIPVIPRAEMLGELMRGKVGIAIAGSHGKTTTTSMMASVLSEKDPTVIIGGRVDAFGGNFRLGKGQIVIAEADESDGSFLHLPATYGVITNIDNDHLDYYGNLESVDEAFLSFVGKLPFYGLAVVCGDDPGVKRCMSRWTKPVFTYGFEEGNHYQAREIILRSQRVHFKVFKKLNQQSSLLGSVEMKVLGKFNILNALSTIALADQIGISFETTAEGLREFRGVRRRFEVCFEDKKNHRVIVDDYAHHPTEIRCSLEIARQYWKGRIIVVFQPHRYSRTLHCREGFLSAFHLADEVWLTDIYSAGESPLEGVSSPSLVNELKKTGHAKQHFRFVGDLENARNQVIQSFQKDDLVICMGAGSITRLPKMILEHL